MDIEKSVRDFINDNFFLIGDNDFMVFDKTLGYGASIPTFYLTIETIFGNGVVNKNKIIFNVCENWINEKIENVNYKIKEIGYEFGTKYLVEKLYEGLNDDVSVTKFSIDFIKKLISGDDYVKQLRYKVEIFVNNLNLHNLNSYELIKLYDETFPVEVEEIKRGVHDFLFMLYFKKKTKPKVETILSQLVLRLGHKNWEIIRVGKGIFTYSDLNKMFLDEHITQINEVQNIFNDWYYNKVVELTSEHLIKKI